MKKRYLIILSVVLCMFLGLSSVSAYDLEWMDDEVSTFIKINPSKIEGIEGDDVILFAEVNHRPLFGRDEVIRKGNLSLLEDGKVIQVIDLSENCFPMFSFTLERGHTYSLKYDKCIRYEYYHGQYSWYHSSSKEIPVTVYPYPWYIDRCD